MGAAGAVFEFSGRLGGGGRREVRLDVLIEDAANDLFFGFGHGCDVRCSSGAFADPEMAESFVEGAPNGTLAEDLPGGDEILLELRGARDVSLDEGAVEGDGDVGAKIVRAADETIATHLQAYEDQKFVTGDDGEIRVMAGELEDGLEVGVIGVADFDTGEVGDLLVEAGDGIGLDVIFGEDGIVVEEEGDIDGGGDFREIRNEVFLRGDEVEGREDGEEVDTFGGDALGHFDGATGAGFAEAAHDGDLVIDLGDGSGDGADLLIVGEKGEAAHGAIGEDGVDSGGEEELIQAAEAGLIDRVVMGEGGTDGRDDAAEFHVLKFTYCRQTTASDKTE